MSQSTKIEWCDATVNCFAGCIKMSEGCENCYALAMTKRLNAMGKGLYHDLISPDGIDWSGTINYDLERLKEVLKWRKPKRIFVNSMSDTFHRHIGEEVLDELFAVMALARQHTFMLLTKRYARMQRYLGNWSKYDNRTDAINQKALEISNGEVAFVCDSEEPIPNIWLGITAENQRCCQERLQYLLMTPAAVRFISLEPMLNKIDLITASDFPMKVGDSYEVPAVSLNDWLHWVIIGAETGPGRRPCKVEWVESVVSQCDRAGIPVFIKALDIGGELVKDIRMFPKHLQRREFPK